MTTKVIETNSDTGGASSSEPLPLALRECECICHVNGNPYSCGAMCWHPQLDTSEYEIELATSTNNVDHYVRLLAVYSFGKLKYLIFEPSNGPVQRFEVN